MDKTVSNQNKHLQLLCKRMKSLNSNYQEIGDCCGMSMANVNAVLTGKIPYDYINVQKIESAITQLYFLRQRELVKYF